MLKDPESVKALDRLVGFLGSRGLVAGGDSAVLLHTASVVFDTPLATATEMASLIGGLGRVERRRRYRKNLCKVASRFYPRTSRGVFGTGDRNG